LGFWNFPETAWCVLGSWKRNRLAAHSRPLGDARRLNQLLGLLMKRLAGLVKPPSGAGQSDSFWVFWHFGLNLVGLRVSDNYYGTILMISGGYNHEIEGLNEWNSAYEFRVECVRSVFMV